MAVTTQSTPSLADQHADLERRIADLQTWRTELCQLGQPRFGEMGTRLREIGRILEGHFAAEEAGGYLASVVEAAPELAAQVDELRGQHAALRTQLETLVNDLTATPVRFPDWDRACVACGRLLNALRSHEHAENALVQMALETDVGDAD